MSPASPIFGDARRRLEQMRDWDVFRDRLRRLPGHVRTAGSLRKRALFERGYVLFQDFIPDNAYDTRITVVGNRAWGFTRDVRTGDFRASGSGKTNYDRERIHPDCIRIAFAAAAALGSQSTAFDFVLRTGEPLIVEFSYGYVPEAVHDAGGHWTADLSWHEGPSWPEHVILDNLLEEIKQSKTGAGQ